MATNSTTTDETGFAVGMKNPRKISTKLRGVPDFTNAAQFNLYESGYEYVLVCRVPTFIQVLASKGAYTEDGMTVNTLLNNFITTIEQEDKGLDGIEDITIDPLDITDGISTLSMIGKVNMQSNSSFSMTFTEKTGTPIVKFCEYYIKGIKDPRTQVKTYHGALDKGWIDRPGLEKEVFTLLYINTDNTKKKIEKAYLLCNVQLTKAETSTYNATKGDIATKDVTLEMSGFPICGKQVNSLAKEMLKYLYTRTDGNKVILNSYDYDYFMTNEKSRGFSYKGVNNQLHEAGNNPTYSTLGTTEK